MILAETERLYHFGFAPHWIKENSKAPVKARWSEPTRDSLKVLRREYREGFGLGVKLGTASKLTDGHYLANIDVDIKSSKPHHKAEALEKLDEFFPGLFDSAPCVKTGNGYRLFLKTSTPSPSRKIAKSEELTRVHLPTSEITGGQRAMVKKGLITDQELEEGWRIRPAWELELMGEGKQGLIPPSIHPETGRPYRWTRPIEDVGGIPLIGAQELDFGVEDRKRDSARVSKADGGFTPVKYDLSKLTDEQIGMIKEGDGVDDRSAAAFSITLAMFRAGYSTEEIISALTDRNNFLGEVSYDHRKTKKRSRAAEWVRKYCIAKAEDEISGRNAFGSDPGDNPILDSEEAVKAQTKKLAHTHVNLSEQLAKNKNGSPLPSFANAELILMHHAGNAMGRDEFAVYDRYLKSPPWGWPIGRVVGDKDDLVVIKSWMNEKYGIAPALSVIDEIVTKISVSNAYHPIKRELEALPEWDGKNRIDYWLTKYFGALLDPQYYVGDVFRKWLVASIMRVYQPGYKMDWMPVLEGPTGVGKGEFAKILAGPGYHIDNLPNLEKTADAALQLEGARIVEFEELSALKGATSETIKGFISRQRDKVRRPYDKKPVYIERQCVFIGTTNHETYLFDETGNRRYMPIRVGELNIKQLKKDRDQLWAEAFCIYQNFGGELLYLEGESLKYSKQIQSEKMVATESSTMLEAIVDFRDSDKSKDFNFSRFKMMHLFDAFGPLASWKQDARSVQAAAIALKHLGASKKKSDGLMVWHLPRK